MEESLRKGWDFANWADKANYDIYMNSGFLGAEKTAEAICSMVQEKVSAVKREE